MDRPEVADEWIVQRGQKRFGVKKKVATHAWALHCALEKLTQHDGE
ncbi:hypothetical protein [Amycolatopsis lexingtonensis]